MTTVKETWINSNSCEMGVGSSGLYTTTFIGAINLIWVPRKKKKGKEREEERRDIDKIKKT